MLEQLAALMNNTPNFNSLVFYNIILLDMLTTNWGKMAEKS